MENSKQLNPSDSLQIIAEAIQKTKENIQEQSFYYILWGWLILIASLGNYLLITFTSFEYSSLPWFILIPLGWIASIVHSIKRERTIHYQTHLEVFLKHLWIVLGISFAIAVFITIYLKVSPVSMVLLLAGAGTLISGLSMKFKPLSIGGIVLFVFAIIGLFVNGPDTLLVNAAATFFGYLIPAYFLKNSN